MFFATGLIAYQGNWSNNLQDGEGREYSKDVGALRDPFDFKDLSTLANNWVKYVGNFKDGKREGDGTLTLTNGERLVGKWCNGLVDGIATIHKTDGCKIVGKWCHGKQKATCVEGKMT